MEQRRYLLWKQETTTLLSVGCFITDTWLGPSCFVFFISEFYDFRQVLEPLGFGTSTCHSGGGDKEGNSCLL